jgi:homotetrameric cytidine deaminase
MKDTVLTALRARAASLLPRAYVPFSRQPDAVVLLCEGGVLVPGVRVESATFPLTISASLNALTSAVALGAPPPLAVVSTRAFDAYDAALWASNAVAPMRVEADGTAQIEGGALPTPGEFISPFLPGLAATTVEAGIAAAQVAASRAFVPASDFPVGTALRVRDGEEARFVPGCNVEPGAWPFTLCGERNALSTVLSYGLALPEAAFLTCLHDPTGTPCGACRQLLCEHLPTTAIWQDRGADEPEQTTPQDLLPGFFAGLTLTDS